MAEASKYVLDTNTLSALMKQEEHVIARLEQLPKSSIFAPQPALAEIAFGIERLPPSKKQDLLRERIALLRDEIPRMPWSDTVTDAFGLIKATLQRRGQTIEDFDAAIAAHAVGENVVLVTTDSQHMSRVPGIKVEDWSSPED